MKAQSGQVTRPAPTTTGLGLGRRQHVPGLLQALDLQEPSLASDSLRPRQSWRWRRGVPDPWSRSAPSFSPGRSSPRPPLPLLWLLRNRAAPGHEVHLGLAGRPADPPRPPGTDTCTHCPRGGPLSPADVRTRAAWEALSRGCARVLFAALAGPESRFWGSGCAVKTHVPSVSPGAADPRLSAGRGERPQARCSSGSQVPRAPLASSRRPTSLVLLFQ
jgi:hypothetical protein